ncbi:hypothetical protein HPB47_005304 [Ixodes persulcatus]|uniref:Uncharacterized protein n=1 Tax=Ixodes persulcatus TaxID=34615 RepID=A0AC60PDC1_IXOPE|nr:hypothetical protein HPB47_005304 [Ixodes persulcatus]
MSRFVCVFHGSNTQGNFGTRNFPYAYCHHLVYCCVGVEASSSDGDVLKNVSALSNNQCTVGVIFGEQAEGLKFTEEIPENPILQFLELKDGMSGTQRVSCALPTPVAASIPEQDRQDFVGSAVRSACAHPPPPSSGGSLVPSVLEELRGARLKLLESDKTGVFVIMEEDLFGVKVGAALDKNFILLKKRPSGSLRSKVKDLCTNLDLPALRNAIAAPSKQYLTVFFSAKTHKPDVPLRSIISENGCWQKRLASFLLKHLTSLTLPQPFRITNSLDLISHLTPLHDSPAPLGLFSLDIEDMYFNLDVHYLLESVSNAIDENGMCKFQNASGVSVKGFLSLLDLYLRSTLVEYEGKIYIQKAGVCIGSCLAPILSEIFLMYVDRAIKAKLEATAPGCQVFRYVDDYLVLHQEQTKPETILKAFASSPAGLTFKKEDPSDDMCHKCPRALVHTNHKTAGSAEKDDTDLNMLLSDPWRSAQFAARLLGLHSSAPFSSAYLYWKQPSPSNKNHLTRLAVTLRKKLVSHSVDLGLVIDGAGDVTSSFNFRGLLKVLGAGLLTAPPFYPPAKLSHPYHGNEALRWHENFASLVGPARNKVCHTISVAATALHSAAENTLVPFGTLCRRGYLTDDAVPSRGDTLEEVARPQGTRVATEEAVTCPGINLQHLISPKSDRTWNLLLVNYITDAQRERHGHAHFAIFEPKRCRGCDKWATLARSASGDVISYLHPDRARSYVAAVHKRSRSACLGFWNPEFDDYAGSCGGPSYPVIRAVVGNPVE